MTPLVMPETAVAGLRLISTIPPPSLPTAVVPKLTLCDPPSRSRRFIVVGRNLARAPQVVEGRIARISKPFIQPVRRPAQCTMPIAQLRTTLDTPHTSAPTGSHASIDAQGDSCEPWAYGARPQDARRRVLAITSTPLERHAVTPDGQVSKESSGEPPAPACSRLAGLVGPARQPPAPCEARRPCPDALEQAGPVDGRLRSQHFVAQFAAATPPQRRRPSRARS